MATADPSPLEGLRNRHGLRIRHLRAARKAALEERARLASLVASKRLVPQDTAFVVFGSLARGEWTVGSDLDWALLVDGPADQAHLTAAQEIGKELEKARNKQPGPDQLFGGLAFSHQLIHLIGGDADSNRNITQRVLLLLESVAPDPGDRIRQQVLRMLLARYLADDFGHSAAGGSSEHVPRFLLNDIVRYWRTMAVDFAAKRRLRRGAGWGLRNFKLRMSRKLIFSAGLGACLSCLLRPPMAPRRRTRTAEDRSALMSDHLLKVLGMPPLDVVAWLAREFSATRKTVRDLFESYDEFLAIIDDSAQRKHLDHLVPEDALTDALFMKTKGVGIRFQAGLTALFFKTDPALTKAALRYGVF